MQRSAAADFGLFEFDDAKWRYFQPFGELRLSSYRVHRGWRAPSPLAAGILPRRPETLKASIEVRNGVLHPIGYN